MQACECETFFYFLEDFVSVNSVEFSDDGMDLSMITKWTNSEPNHDFPLKYVNYGNKYVSSRLCKQNLFRALSVNTELLELALRFCLGSNLSLCRNYP